MAVFFFKNYFYLVCLKRYYKISAKMLAMLNHSWGIKINNNNIIRVRTEIILIKELESTIFSTLNLTSSFFLEKK